MHPAFAEQSPISTWPGQRAVENRLPSMGNGLIEGVKQLVDLDCVERFGIERTLIRVARTSVADPGQPVAA